MALYSPDSTSIASGDTVASASGVTYPDSFTYVASAAGTYYLDVYVYSGAGDYSVTYSLEDPGSIRGKISVTGAADLSNIYVTAYQSDGAGGWNYVSDTYAASDGTYNIGGLASGDYRIRFRDDSGTSSYLTQYYAGKADLDSATDVPVTVGTTTSGINATLVEAGHIIGLVTNASSHGLANITVTAYQPDGSGGWSSVSSTSTTSGGGYNLGGLAAGSCRVQFTDDSGLYGGVWYANKQNLAAATDVAVTAGVTTPGINATLAAAGHITGTVTDAGHAGLAHMTVTAYEADGLGGWSYVNEATTATDGTYNLGGLGSGSYRLEIADYYWGDYYTQYYDDKPSLDATNDVAVSGGATTGGINAALASALTVDTTPPTTSVSGVDALWHHSPVTLTLRASDNAGGSGMSGGQAKTEYKIDGALTWTTGTSVTVAAPADHSGDGSHTVSYRSTDAAGNVEATTICTVKIDTTSPAGSFALAGSAAQTTSTAVTGTSSVTEANGPVQMRFSTDAKATWSSWAAYAAVADLTLPSGAGSKTVWAQYRDAAGNVLELSDAIELIVAPPLDTTDPAVAATGVSPGAWLRSAALVMLTATDEVGGSGLLSITYVLDGGLPQTVIGASVPVGVPLLPNAAHTLVYHATDVAANSCADKTLSFTIDTVGPITAGKATSGRKGRAITLRYRVSDNLSLKATAIRIVVKNSRGSAVKTFKPTSQNTTVWYSVKWTPKAKGTYRYYVYAKDLAGNGQSKVDSAKVVVR